MWGLVRRLLTVQTLFVVLGAYVLAAASALAFLELGDAGTLLAFVTLAFSVVAMGVLGAYVRWMRKQVADMNSPPPGWERDRVPEDE
jgi:Zn-dependent protease with chaperone function